MKRVVGLAVGWILVALGVVGLFLPLLQGLALIALGLVILGRSSEFLREAGARLVRRFPALDRVRRRVLRSTGKAPRAEPVRPGGTVAGQGAGSAGTKTGSWDKASTTEP